MKHTPGPWKMKCKGKQLDYWLVGPCSVTGKANAELVSAAPELLEALANLVAEIYKSGCIEYMSESEFTDVFINRVNMAQAAVDKANGGEE